MRYTYYSAAIAAGLFIADQWYVRSKRICLNYAAISENEISNAATEAKKTLSSQPDNLTELEKHVLFFGKFTSGKVHFDTITTAFALRNLGEPLWPVIGFFVALGSKLQAGKCPFGSAQFDIKKGLHLHTSRIWDQDGHFDDVRWERILNIIKPKDNLISQSAWESAIAELAKTDRPEESTNRQIGTGVHSEKTQSIAAEKESKEMFKLLGMKQGNDLVIPTQLIELFFKDTRLAIETLRLLQKKQLLQMKSQQSETSSTLACK